MSAQGRLLAVLSTVVHPDACHQVDVIDAATSALVRTYLLHPHDLRALRDAINAHLAADEATPLDQARRAWRDFDRAGAFYDAATALDSLQPIRAPLPDQRMVFEQGKRR